MLFFKLSFAISSFTNACTYFEIPLANKENQGDLVVGRTMESGNLMGGHSTSWRVGVHARNNTIQAGAEKAKGEGKLIGIIEIRD